VLRHRAAVAGRVTRRDAGLPGHHADLGQRAADLAFAASVGTVLAGGFRRDEALLGVWAAVAVAAAVASRRRRRRGRRSGARLGQIVEV